MNYDRVTNQEGYRVDDLNEEHQNALRVPYYLLEDFKNIDAESILSMYGGMYLDEERLLDKMILEVCEDFKEAVEQWLLSNIQAFQISFGDDEGMEEGESE